MSISLYLDHHVPGAVTEGLRQRGVDVLTAIEDDYSRADDESLLERATDLGRVPYTHDQDYLAIADRRRQTGREFAGIVYTHQKSVSIGKAIDDLELIAKTSGPEQMRDSVQFIPL